MLIRHSFIYLLGRVAPAGVALASLALFTRFLTPSEYGTYALTITLTGFANVVCYQWLALSAARFYPENSGHPDALLSTVLMSFFVITLAIGVLGLIALGVFGQSNRPLIYGAVALSWAQAWFDLNLRLVNANLRPTLYGALTTIKAIAGFCLSMILIKTGAGAAGPVIGMFVGLLLPTFVVVKYWEKAVVRSFDRTLFLKCVKYGSPFIATYSLIFAIDASSRVLLKYFMGSAAVGVYAPAYDLAQQSLGVLMSVTHLAALPLAIQAYAKDGVDAAKVQIQKNGLLFFAVSLPATAGLVLLAGHLTEQLMGGQFSGGGAQIVRITAVATFISGFRSYYVDYPFYLVQSGGRQLIGVLSAVVVNIFLCCLLIPLWGHAGAAYATLIAFFVAALCSMQMGKVLFRLPVLHRETYKVLLATGMLSFLLYSSDAWRGTVALVSKLGFGVGIYFFILLVLNFCGCRGRFLLQKVP